MEIVLCWLTFKERGHFLLTGLCGGADGGGGLVARHPAVLSRLHQKVTPSVSRPCARSPPASPGSTPSWTPTPRPSGLSSQTRRSASGQSSFFFFHSALKE